MTNSTKNPSADLILPRYACFDVPRLSERASDTAYFAVKWHGIPEEEVIKGKIVATAKKGVSPAVPETEIRSQNAVTGEDLSVLCNALRSTAEYIISTLSGSVYHDPVFPKVSKVID